MVALRKQNPIKTILKIHTHYTTIRQPENCLTSYEPHGYCVIYSSADRASFILAERIIQSLWTSENIAQKAVILVGNKADLARSRCVTTEGKNLRERKKCFSLFGCFGRKICRITQKIVPTIFRGKSYGNRIRLQIHRDIGRH